MRSRLDLRAQRPGPFRTHQVGGGGSKRGKRLKNNKNQSTQGTAAGLAASFSSCSTDRESMGFLFQGLPLSDRGSQRHQKLLARRLRQRANRRQGQLAARCARDPALRDLAQSRPSPKRAHQSNRQLRRQRERCARKRSETRRRTVELLAQLVNRHGGTKLEGSTLGLLHNWRSATAEEPKAEHGCLDSTTGQSSGRWVAVQPTAAPSSKPRTLEDGILLIIPARIFGKPV